MTISTRTWEGIPHLCPVCNHESPMLVSDVGDSCCPACGSLMWIQEHGPEPARSFEEEHTITPVMRYESWIVEHRMTYPMRRQTLSPTDAYKKWLEDIPAAAAAHKKQLKEIADALYSKNIK